MLRTKEKQLLCDITSAVIKLEIQPMQCKSDNVQSCAGLSRDFTLSPEQEIRLRPDTAELHSDVQVLLNKR